MLSNLLHPLMRPLLAALVVASVAPATQAGDLQLGAQYAGGKGKVTIQVGHGYGKGLVLGSKHRAHRQRRVAAQSCDLHRRCIPQKQYVPGHYETVERKVWVPESKQKVWIPACYETRYDPCGLPYQVMVSPGRWDVVCTPGYFETRCEQVWVPGCFKTTCAVY